MFTIDDWTSVQNNPFSADGLTFDPAYEQRLDRLIRAFDEIGMVVIVSLFYWSQAIQFKDGQAIRNAVKTACELLKKGNYTNVIIEVANEFDISRFKSLPLIYEPQGMSY
ncbi:glycoside hydrolase family 5 protein [Paenibacillus sp. S3N08]|uniref:Glycoside hydrolase family 5 protein n=1 Tax=Paenibacillus agricola TaxID=2716264 RepID=A0ABX0JA29_9BACL|nr:glycoside hydrolase family 5 protein [Paenibacillus agricola]